MENKIKIGYKVMAYSPKSLRVWKTIGIIHDIKDGIVTFYNKNNPKGYEYYTMSYKEVLQYFREKLYK